jgi:uncharacterized protein YecE (DUF72 family)
MEFGRVAPEGLKEINFVLPPDPQQTIETLKESNDTDNFDLRIGATKWGRKEWLGSLYPKGTNESDFLLEYVKHFNGLFLNATFYQIYKPEQILKWKEQAASNPGFKFYPVMAQNISHIRRLKNADELTVQYIAGVKAFGENLGPSLLQLGDNFSPKSFPELKAYLEAFPKDFQIFVELRNKDWWTTEWLAKLDDLFYNNHVGFAITDAAGRRDCVHMHLTIPKAFIRFASTDDTELDKRRLAQWALRLLDWKKKGLQSAGFFITGPVEYKTPELCRYFSVQMAKTA